MLSGVIFISIMFLKRVYPHYLALINQGDGEFNRPLFGLFETSEPN